MLQAIEQFRQNLSRVKDLHGLYLSLQSTVTSAIDISDILRAEIVMMVSALDHYVHELSRLGMLEALDGKRPPTDSLLRFEVSVATLLSALGGTAGAVLFEAEVRQRHSFQSFQHPDRIADAVRFFSSVELWNSVAAEINEEPQILKTRVRLLVERRNKISHEADSDPSFPGARWPITANMVEESAQFVRELCEAIHKVTA